MNWIKSILNYFLSSYNRIDYKYCPFEEAIDLLKHQDNKDVFWRIVQDQNYLPISSDSENWMIHIEKVERVKFL